MNPSRDIDGGVNSWNLTLVTPDPEKHGHLPSLDSEQHPLRYSEIKESLMALVAECSLDIQFI